MTVPTICDVPGFRPCSVRWYFPPAPVSCVHPLLSVSMPCFGGRMRVVGCLQVTWMESGDSGVSSGWEALRICWTALCWRNWGTLTCQKPSSILLGNLLQLQWIPNKVQRIIQSATIFKKSEEVFIGNCSLFLKWNQH